jgi:hypothetical protein
MKSSKILAVVAMASLFAASSYAADATEEVLGTYGAITIKKVTYDEHENPDWDGSPIVTREKTVAYIDDESKKTPKIDKNIEVDSVYFTRVFKKGVYSTLMLPFEVPAWLLRIDLFEIVDVVKECDNCGVSIYARHRNSNKLKANMPYLAISEISDHSISFNLDEVENQDKIVFNTTTNDRYRRFKDSKGLCNWDFTGTYELIEFKNPKGIYGFAGVERENTKIGDFRRATCKDGKCASIRPFRAYLKVSLASLNKSDSEDVELPESISVYLIDSDKKGTTYIGQMNTSTGEIVKEDNRWFDMKGRVLDHKPTAKGTYYNNKKKVIIK